MADTKTNMMGSKADMISSKFDEVARNSIWREHLAKEQRTVPKSTKFVLNPSTMIPITRKPGEKVERPKHTTDDADFKELQATMKRSTMMPQAKSRYPMTASQEVGWSWDEAEPDKFKHLKASCSETKYAESYVRMSGANPYAKTG